MQTLTPLVIPIPTTSRSELTPSMSARSIRNFSGLNFRPSSSRSFVRPPVTPPDNKDQNVDEYISLPDLSDATDRRTFTLPDNTKHHSPALQLPSLCSEQPDRNCFAAEYQINTDFVSTCPMSFVGAVNCQPPVGTMYSCRVKRERRGTRLTRYYLYTLLTESGRIVMCSKKLGGKRGSYFTITGTSETNLGNKKHPLYLGKLRSNFIGSQYRLFSPGWNPSKAAHANMYQLFRRELLVVLYSNMLWKSVGTKGPRKMTVAVPSVIHPTDYYTDHEALLRAAKTVARDASVSTDCHPTGVEILENKEPRWNASINGYVLNFSERVKEPSVKNFQLVKSERIKRVEENPSGPNIDQVILQFGRLNDTEYSLDFASPITPLMAFALALSSLDFKLCCE